jgi:hypothetical protein
MCKELISPGRFQCDTPLIHDQFSTSPELTCKCTFEDKDALYLEPIAQLPTCTNSCPNCYKHDADCVCVIGAFAVRLAKSAQTSNLPPRARS